MTKKIPKNFYIPEPVYEAFLEIAGTVNEKQQWAVISAAVMALVEAGPRGQELIDLAMSADRRDDFSSVLNDLRPEPLQLNTAAASPGKLRRKAAKPRQNRDEKKDEEE